MPRPSMEKVYMDFAKSLATRGTCVERQVGVVVTSRDYEQVYSVGYNGNASGRRNTCDHIGWKGSCGCIHAEQNALIKCSVKDKKKVMFMTLSPCPLCAKMMVNSGFSVVFISEVWKDLSGINILKDAGIGVFVMAEDGTITPHYK